METLLFNSLQSLLAPYNDSRLVYLDLDLDNSRQEPEAITKGFQLLHLTTNGSCKVEEEVLNIEYKCKLRSNVSRDQKVRVLVLNARSIVNMLYFVNMKKRLELEVIVKKFGYKIIAVISVVPPLCSI